MDTFISILLWGGLFFLMMRFGCGSHMFGHGSKHKKESSAASHGGHGGGGHGGCCGSGGGKRSEKAADAEPLVWVAPEKDTDPVCGEIVSPAEAKSSVHDGQVYYFCSTECREDFEILPEQYVGQEDPQEVRRLDHSPDQGGSHG